jgi:hypothetical protein
VRLVSLIAPLLVAAWLALLSAPALADDDGGLQQRRGVGDLTADVWLAPGVFRPTGVEVRLTDQSGAAPGDVRRVDVAFAMRGMSHGARGIEADAVELGLYQAGAYLLAMPGSWWMALRVERADGRVDSVLFPFEAPYERTGVSSRLYTRPTDPVQVEDLAVYPEGVAPDHLDVVAARPVRLEVMYVDGAACGDRVTLADASASAPVSPEGLAELAFTPARTASLALTCTPTGLLIGQ